MNAAYPPITVPATPLRRRALASLQDPTPHPQPKRPLPKRRPPPNQQPKALDCCQNYCSPRARSAPTRPSEPARDREAPYSRLSPRAPSVQARRRLWTAGRITALPAHGVRLPAPPNQPISNLKSPPTRWPGPSQAHPSQRAHHPNKPSHPTSPSHFSLPTSPICRYQAEFAV